MLIESIILGIIQGVAEWLPVSSEGLITLISLNFFQKDLLASINTAAFLHLGTFFAALIYFRHDVKNLVLVILRPKNANVEYKKILVFLIISTLISGVIGLSLLKLFLNIEKSLEKFTNFITMLIGFFLIITALLQFKKPEERFKKPEEIKHGDGIILGIAQGFAALPGLSRSGLTIASLLFKKFRDSQALRLSFLMSLPAVLGGNILLQFLENSSLDVLNPYLFIGAFTSFIIGLISIHALIKISKKINFGWFALFFGALTLIAVFV
jgi:undecaprenyl-diphosphatase